MPVARIPFTFVVRISGRNYWRFRRGKLRDALPGQPGESLFHSRYSELLAASNVASRVPDHGTFEWLINRYRKSVELAALSDPTQLDYDRTLTLLDKELGDQPYAYTTRPMIRAVQENYASTPRKMHKIKQMLSVLYTWADDHNHVPPGFNPTKGIKKPRTKGGVKEYEGWSDFEIAAYLAVAPEYAQTPVLIALYTGQRRQDVVAMTWKQLQGDSVRVRQSKTKTLLTIKLHPKLHQHLSGLKRRGVQICTNAQGLPYPSVNSLSGVVRRIVEACPDMPNNRSMHGLKYAAGAVMEEAGCTIGEIEAVLGNRAATMAMKYSTQRVRARSAIDKTAKLSE